MDNCEELEINYNELLKMLRFQEEVNIAVCGQVKQGKSTLVNTLLGFELDSEGQYPPGAAPVSESGTITQEPTQYRNPDLGKGIFSNTENFFYY